MVVRQAAVVKHLQQYVKHIHMGLFHLVQQDDGVGSAANCLGELATLVIADIPRRRPHQATDRMPLHELTHVNPDDGGFVVEENFGESFAEFRFANSRWTEEEERANWSMGILQSATTAADRIGDRSHGFVLTDQPLLQAFFKHEQCFSVSNIRDTGTPVQA